MENSPVLHSAARPDRLHALDNLRAILMWLGIVLHASVNHMTTAAIMPWRDSETTPWADLLLFVIHAFRMPAFFIVAGFFVCMLVVQRGAGGMLKHRARRLALPFAVFWPLLFAATIPLLLIFVHLSVRGTIGMDASLIPAKMGNQGPNTMHLWFLYYLFLFCLLTAALARLPQGLRDGVAVLLRGAASRWWGFLALALPLACIGAFHRAGIVTVNGSFIPNPPEVLHNGLYFLFGLCLYGARASLLPLFAQRRWINLGLGLLPLTAYMVLAELEKRGLQDGMEMRFVMAWLYTAASWLWSFAALGLAVHFLAKPSKVLAYVADSSYWVYLVHMLGTIGFGILLYHSPFGALGRLGLNILLTSAACLVTYHLLVRRTFIGVLLNGRKVKDIRRNTASPIVAL